GRPIGWLLGVAGPHLPEAGAKLSRRFRAAQLRRGLAQSPAQAHFAWRQVGDGVIGLAGDLFKEVAQYDPADTFHSYYRRVRGASWLDRVLYVDSQTWLRDDILVKVDRASMAASLEYRAPFLDYRVVEFAARLPSRLKLRGWHTKVILKALARRFLPAEIVDRKKAGFNSPTVTWLRGPLR